MLRSRRDFTTPTTRLPDEARGESEFALGKGTHCILRVKTDTSDYLALSSD